MTKPMFEFVRRSAGLQPCIKGPTGQMCPVRGDDTSIEALVVWLNRQCEQQAKLQHAERS